MEELKNPYSFALLAGFIGSTVSFIENKVYKTEESGNYYLKTFIFITILTLVILFLYDSVKFTQLQGISLNNQDILTGDPGF